MTPGALCSPATGPDLIGVHPPLTEAIGSRPRTWLARGGRWSPIGEGAAPSGRRQRPYRTRVPAAGLAWRGDRPWGRSPLPPAVGRRSGRGGHLVALHPAVAEPDHPAGTGGQVGVVGHDHERHPLVP